MSRAVHDASRLTTPTHIKYSNVCTDRLFISVEDVRRMPDGAAIATPHTVDTYGRSCYSVGVLRSLLVIYNIFDVIALFGCCWWRHFRFIFRRSEFIARFAFGLFFILAPSVCHTFIYVRCSRQTWHMFDILGNIHQETRTEPPWTEQHNHLTQRFNILINI